MRVAVVGGGYTGCLSALYLLKSGHNVTLYEAGHDVGGVLRDIVDRGEIFFNGCQYLRFQSLHDSGLLKHCYEFPHHYGSLTSIGSCAPRVYDDIAQPSIIGKCSLNPTLPIYGNVSNRLKSLRGNYAELANWASSWGDLDKLDWRCSIPMQVSRFHFPDDPDVQFLREADSRMISLTAIPRSLRMPGVPIETAFLPKRGYNIFFNLLKEQLLALGGVVKLNTPIKLIEDKHGLSLRSRGQIFRHDLIVWASNPVQPLKTLCRLRLTTPPVMMKVFFGDLPDISFSAQPIPYYWQVFSRSCPITRFYIYRMQGRLRFTVEAFDHNDDGLIIKQIEDIQSILDLGSSLNVRGSLLQRRYVNFSTDEYNSVENATSHLISRRLIPGAWFTYGREEKVASILEHLKQSIDFPVEEDICLEDA